MSHCCCFNLNAFDFYCEAVTGNGLYLSGRLALTAIKNVFTKPDNGNFLHFGSRLVSNIAGSNWTRTGAVTWSVALLTPQHGNKLYCVLLLCPSWLTYLLKQHEFIWLHCKQNIPVAFLCVSDRVTAHGVFVVALNLTCSCPKLPSSLPNQPGLKSYELQLWMSHRMKIIMFVNFTT